MNGIAGSVLPCDKGAGSLNPATVRNWPRATAAQISGAIRRTRLQVRGLASLPAAALGWHTDRWPGRPKGAWGGAYGTCPLHPEAAPVYMTL